MRADYRFRSGRYSGYPYSLLKNCTISRRYWTRAYHCGSGWLDAGKGELLYVFGIDVFKISISEKACWLLVVHHKKEGSYIIRKYRCMKKN